MSGNAGGMSGRIVGGNVRIPIYKKGDFESDTAGTNGKPGQCVQCTRAIVHALQRQTVYVCYSTRVTEAKV